MALASEHVQVHGQLAGFFSTIQEGQAPSHFTQKYLKDLGFTSANHRAFIPLLKALGFLTPDGSPTQRYREYRDKSQSRRVMADALREAYEEVFYIKERPTEDDRDLVIGKFKSTHNVSDLVAKRMANTFYALLELADLNYASGGSGSDNKGDKEDSSESEHREVRQMPSTPPPGLHYNIQIHLPATKDVEVFNAIFRSLREHLLE